MNINQLKLKEIINKHFPNESIKSVQLLNTVIKTNYRILVKNQIFYLKIKTKEWADLKHEEIVTKMLNEQGLNLPKILVVNEDLDIIPYPYLIQEEKEGTKLMDLITDKSSIELMGIYKAMGRFYQKMHQIKFSKSGLFSDQPDQILYPVTPNEFMLENEIINGSGLKALNEGYITKETYHLLVEIFKGHQSYLRNHQSTLINVSSFPWTIYLNDKVGWRVTKLMGLSDVVWWDPDFELALIKYPPFFSEIKQEYWESFIDQYGRKPEEKKILLYSILQRLCAAMGVYMEPLIKEKEQWKKTFFKKLPSFLIRINTL